MKTLFEAARVEEVKGRIAKLRPDSERLWGSMSAAQMVAHCAAGLELAAGDRRPPRALMGEGHWLDHQAAGAGKRRTDAPECSDDDCGAR